MFAFWDELELRTPSTRLLEWNTPSRSHARGEHVILNLLEIILMKSQAMISAAVLSFAFFSGSVQARAAQADSNPSTGHALAMRMVPAQVVVTKTIDAKKAQAGQQFEMELSSKVKLQSGQELPKGAVLVGTIVTDEVNAKGTSKLSLRFTQARLKDGKTVPVQAVITGAYSQDSLNAQYGNSGWAPGQINVQQNGTLGSLNLISQVGGNDSGTFETKKDNVKLDRGSALSLAIAPGEGSSATGN
jgi:hypothetical protein